MTDTEDLDARIEAALRRLGEENARTVTGRGAIDLAAELDDDTIVMDPGAMHVDVLHAAGHWRPAQVRAYAEGGSR